MSDPGVPSTDLVRWLDDRRPAPPPSLRRALESTLARWASEADVAVAEPARGAPPGPADAGVAERLADAGLAALGRIAAEPSTRGGALDLLAADALLTYACEAAAEAEASGEAGAVERLTDRLAPGRFDALLPPEVGS
jgi:hypothetical protein